MRIQKSQTFYVTCIRQVATLLEYGAPQVQEVFKNKPPSKLYWVPFPIEDPRQEWKTFKRILMREKIEILQVSQPQHHL